MINHIWKELNNYNPTIATKFIHDAISLHLIKMNDNWILKTRILNTKEKVNNWLMINSLCYYFKVDCNEPTLQYIEYIYNNRILFIPKQLIMTMKDDDESFDKWIKITNNQWHIKYPILSIDKNDKNHDISKRFAPGISFKDLNIE